jgi:hypothetical protein
VLFSCGDKMTSTRLTQCCSATTTTSEGTDPYYAIAREGDRLYYAIAREGDHDQRGRGSQEKIGYQTSGDGGVRTAAHLRLALVSVVVARWSSDLIVIFITFGILCTLLMMINRLVEFRKKNIWAHSPPPPPRLIRRRPGLRD